MKIFPYFAGIKTDNFMSLETFKITKVLSSFNKKDLRRFREFVDSPFYNKNRSVKKLLWVLCEYYPHFSREEITKEKIYQKTFGNEKYSYPKLTNIVSDLYELAEKYLAVISSQEKEFFTERNLFSELRKRELYGIYELRHNKYIKKILGKRIKDEDYFYYLYELNNDYLYFTTQVKPNSRLEILQTEFDNFFCYSVIRMLRFYSLMLHERNQNNKFYDMKLFEEIRIYLKNNNITENPTLQVYITIIDLLKEKNEQSYNMLQQLKEKYFEELRKEDIDLIYVHLYDYAAYMVNFKGDDRYNRDMFNIYKEQIDKGIMYPEGFLYPNYINIVKIACRVGEIEYAEKFMRDFEICLTDDIKIDTLEFCRGVVAFSLKDFSSALKHFSRSNFSNFIFKVQVKIFLLQTYYYMKMYDQAELIIDTFKHFAAKEENILKEHRESYAVFLNIMSNMIRLEHTENPDKKYEINKLIKTAAKMPANPFRIRTWLLENLIEPGNY